MICPKCGKVNREDATLCFSCGSALNEVKHTESVLESGVHTTNVHVQVHVVQKNGVGTAGFILALLGIFLSWVPIIGWVIWFLGAALSVVGLFREPKGLAIAGTVISFIDLIILISAIATCSTLSAFAG